VQGVLEEVLRSALGERDCEGERLRLRVAGRTDRGVHAWRQVASYRHEALQPGRLNALLPDDVAVLASEPAEESFDARRDAISRTYCYRVLARSTRSALLHDRALWWPCPIERDALRACAAAVLGRHDFTAFTPTESEHVHFERNVISAKWCWAGEAPAEGGVPRGVELLELWIEADAFVRHMNRVLVGTMLEVASGKRTLEQFATLLEGRPRADAGPTAPAHGLALASVAYATR
jgi:tRNA pseudouridine38-40 synthase